jgi:hypothetical protein
MDVEATPLHCPYGYIGHIKDFGITPEKSYVMDNCLNNNYTESCHKHIPKETRAAAERCIGLPSCQLNITIESIYGENLGAAPPLCKTEDSVLFV